MESANNRGNWEWTTGEFQTIVTGKNLFLLLYLCFPSLLFTKRLLFIHNSLPQGTLPFYLNVKPKCLCSGKHLDCVHRRMVAWLLCPTRDPTDCNPPDCSVHGILQARILEWIAIFSPGNPPDPRIEPRTPALQEESFTN